MIFAEGSFPDSQHFKRMAWELEEHDTQMIVVPALTDISSERLSSRPVAGLPLVYVERPQAMEAIALGQARLRHHRLRRCCCWSPRRSSPWLPWR